MRFQWKLSHEKRIPPNNDPQPISIASLLNPVDLEESHNSHQNTSERNVSKKMKRWKKESLGRYLQQGNDFISI